MKNKFNFVIGFILGAVIFGSTATFAAVGIMATLTSAKITVNGKEIKSASYVIDGKQYVQLQDLASTLNLKYSVENAESKAAEQATSSDYTLLEDELGVIKLVNEEREKAGLPPVTVNLELCKVARTKAQEMVDLKYLAHESPNYGSPADMIKKFGIEKKGSGECIGRQGGTAPSGVMYNWMNSDGHKKIILNAKYTEVGIGLATDGKGLGYWSLMFIN